MTLGLGLFLLVLLAVGLFSQRANRQLVVVREREVHSRAIVDEIETARRLLVEAESAQRNFLLTDDTLQLDPLRVADGELPKSIERLRRLNADDPEALQETTALEAVAQQRLSSLTATLGVARTDGFAAASARIRGGAGTDAMRRLEEIARSMKRREEERARALLEDAAHKARAAVLAAQAATLFGVLLAALLIALSSRLVAAPIAKLVAGIRRIGDGDLDHRIELDRPDELGAVATAIGEMAGKRKLAEEGLRRAESRLRTLLETLPVGVVIASETGRITQSNAAAERIWGRIPRLEMGQYADYQGFWPDGRRLRAEDWALARALAAGETSVGEIIRIVDFDGVPKTILNNGAPLRDEDGRIFGAVVAFQDISDVVRLQEEQRFLADAGVALAASLDFAATLQRVVELAVPRLADWCSVDVVDGERIRPLAMSGAPALVRTAETRKAFPPDTVPNHPVARVIQSGVPIVTARFADLIDGFAREPEYRRSVEGLGLRSYMVVPLRGAERTLGAITFATHGEMGRVFGAGDLSLAEELARRATLALENARLFREAQDATQLREEVLAVVSHDLKNPLNVIVLHTQLLRRTLPAESLAQAQEALTAIQRASRRAERMATDLVDLAALRAGRLRITRGAESAAKLVEAAVAGLLPLAIERGHSLAGQAEPGLPAVSCDYDRVYQVLSNLVANAIKATRAGGTIEVLVARRDEHAIFSVRDTGPGIDEKDQAHLFERFWRAKDAGYRGTGLGLGIARGLVEAHDGKIWVESEVGRGSTFRFTLPFVSEPTPAPPPRAPSDPSGIELPGSASGRLLG